MLLFGVSSNTYASNACIFNATIWYILATKRFDARLANPWVVWNINIFEYIRQHYRLQNSSGLLNYVPYVLSCLTCLLPYVLLCPTFSRASRARCTSCATSSRASCLTCSRAFCAFCLTCLVSYVPRAKRALVSYVSYVLLYLTCLECSWAARGLNPTCSFAPRLSLASGASSLTCSYASHV